MFVVQGAERIKAAQQEAEAQKRETALAAAALEGRTQALARQEAAAAEAKALLAVHTKELDNREVNLTEALLVRTRLLNAPAMQISLVASCLLPLCITAISTVPAMLKLNRQAEGLPVVEQQVCSAAWLSDALLSHKQWCISKAEEV